MNELSNHDHSRFLTRTNRKVGRVSDLGPESASEGIDRAVFMEAAVMQFTWPGAPTVYYGDEAGVCGYTDPDNRRTYPWGHEDKELIGFHRELIALHRNSRVLRRGSVRVLTAERGILAFARFFPLAAGCIKDQDLSQNADPARHAKEGSFRDAAVVIFNHREEKIQVTVPVWPAEIPDGTELRQVFCSTRGTYFKDPFSYQVTAGSIYAELDPRTAIILFQTLAEKPSL